MVNRNIAKEVPNARFTPKEVKTLYKVLFYIQDLTNQTKIKVAFTPTFDKSLKGDYVTAADIKSMNTRLGNWIAKEGSNPAYVNILAPSNNSGGTTTGSKKGWIQQGFEKQLGKITNITEAINKTRSLGYSYYLNAYKNKGEGSLKENLKRLGNVAMNCVDYTNILANLALEMGYEVRIVQIKCKVASHILFQVRGKEYKNWTNIDISAMADKQSSVCNIGKICWCTNPFGKGVEIAAYNPKWYFNMFLDDLLI